MQTTKEINPKILEQYQKYLKEKEERLNMEKTQKEQTQKRIKEIEEKIRRQCQPHTVTTRKPHICTKCGATIPKGATVTADGIIKIYAFMYSGGSTLRTVTTRYYCPNCHPEQEEQQ